MSAPPPDEVTALLLRWSEGDREALDRLMPLVYEELRRIAERALKREPAGLTLQTTALVHEAYLRLVDQRRAQWQNRVHFCAVAAQAMRRILVDQARRRRAAKRGGLKLSLEEVSEPAVEPRPDLLAMDEALAALAQFDSSLAHLVELRFFGGLTVEEAAAALGVSPATAGRDWATAKAWLYRRLQPG